jgi:hypothetical protein
MSRGKRQVLFDYLPGRVFDFAQVGTIAKVAKVRGTPNNQLNQELVLSAIQQYANAWEEKHRTALRDRNPDYSRFILLDPKSVESALFPLVFHCQNKSCGRIVTRTTETAPAKRTCPRCKQNTLVQLRFVKIHRCGEIQPLTPYCSNCRSAENMALDMRGSERISGFQWKCLTCNTKTSLFAGPCRACDWTDPIPNVDNPRNMDIEVFRAGKTYYAHHVVLLNQPGRDMDTFLQIPEWPMLAAATFLELPEMQGRKLLEFGVTSQTTPPPDIALTNADVDSILARLNSGQITAAEMAEEMQRMRTQRVQQQQASAPNSIAQALIQRTGIAQNTWKAAGREMLEAVLPMESGTIQDLFGASPSAVSGAQQAVRQVASECGISRLTSVNDFPITTATFGYSRTTYQPNRCRLNLFPADADHGGKFPIFVDLVQADAIVIRLDPERVWKWLERNMLVSALPATPLNSPTLQRQSYFISLFDDIEPAVMLRATEPQARMVFGLLHTMSHLCIRQAALLCGLDRTSLSEYVLPRTLSFALYCNHRFGATIGALTSLFEQSLEEWLNQVRNSRRCVYDPVCTSSGGTCHACTHLAETSCRFFNINLSRSFLFGGPDTELGNIGVGYFDASLSS